MSWRQSMVVLCLIAGGGGLLAAYGFASSATESPCATDEESCLARQVVREIVAGDPVRAPQLVADALTRRTLSPDHCTDLMRNVGREVARQESDFLLAELVPGIVMCDYRFFRGYLEGLFEGTTDPVTLGKRYCDHVGQELGLRIPDAKIECLRNFGRVLPFVYRHLHSDVAATAAESVRACVALEEPGEGETRCVLGVFSALSQSATRGEYGLDTIRDPGEFCASMPGRFAMLCKRNLIKGYITGSTPDAEALGDIVTRARTTYPDITADMLSEIVWVAAYRLGRLNVDLVPTTTTAHLEACGASGSELLVPCVSGYAMALAKLGIAGEQHRLVSSYCADAIASLPVSAASCGSSAMKYLRGAYEPALYVRACDYLNRSISFDCASVTPTDSTLGW